MKSILCRTQKVIQSMVDMVKNYVHVTRIPGWQGVPHPWSYPRNLVPGGPSCRMRLTRLSPSLRGGGAVGRWSLLIHTQQRGGVKKKV